MFLNSIILFISALLGGLYALKVTHAKKLHIKSILVFAGSFLFSITLLHILPELFESADNNFSLGLWILVGFFFQQVLEYFTQGVEHGHVHIHKVGSGHSTLTGISLMVALCSHAFLEGLIIAHPLVIHGGHGEGTLLIGIILHKIPAALALMTVLVCQYPDKKTQLILLLIFAVASPLGVLAGHKLGNFQWVDASMLLHLFAFVAGNFLHISITIFIESSPEHQLSLRQLLLSVLGAVAAVVAEFFN